MILVEQKVDWIAAFADRVIALSEGTLRLDGTPREVLTSPLMPEIGVAVPYSTRAARAAREAGLWRTELQLPVTREQAVAGFQAERRVG